MRAGAEVADVAVGVQPPLEPLLARVVEVVRAVARVLPLVVEEEERAEREARGDEDDSDVAGLLEVRFGQALGLAQAGFRCARRGRVLYDKRGRAVFHCRRAVFVVGVQCSSGLVFIGCLEVRTIYDGGNCGLTRIRELR